MYANNNDNNIITNGNETSSNNHSKAAKRNHKCIVNNSEIMYVQIYALVLQNNVRGNRSRKCKQVYTCHCPKSTQSVPS